MLNVTSALSGDGQGGAKDFPIMRSCSFLCEYYAKENKSFSLRKSTLGHEAKMGRVCRQLLAKYIYIYIYIYIAIAYMSTFRHLQKMFTFQFKLSNLKP